MLFDGYWPKADVHNRALKVRLRPIAAIELFSENHFFGDAVDSSAMLAHLSLALDATVRISQHPSIKFLPIIRIHTQIVENPREVVALVLSDRGPADVFVIIAQ